MDRRIYVVRDAIGGYVKDADGEERTPCSNEAYEFSDRYEAEAVCSRATDRVLARDY